MKNSDPVIWSKLYRRDGWAKVLHDGSRASDAHVYHRLHLNRALSIFTNQQLRLGPVEAWPDPYEKWWCEGLFAEQTALEGVNAYALCWTTSSFDEPSWRMFDNNSPVVRLRTTIRSLVEASKAFAHANDGSWFLGSVRYRRQKALHTLASEIVAGNHEEVARTAARMLLHKRNAFRFEKEYRLMFLERGPKRAEVFLPFNTKESISDVMTSPHAKDGQHRAVGTALKPFDVSLRKSGILVTPRPIRPKLK